MLEIIAAATAVLYLLLITRRSWVAWPVYIISSLLYLPVFWAAKLYGDAALQIYFVSAGFYAWWRWGRTEGPTRVERWSLRAHYWIVACWVFASILLGYLLSSTPVGTLGYVDAFVTVGSVIATVLTARGVLENWIYWIVINGVATALFGGRGLLATMWLYGLYTILALRGLYVWKRALRCPDSR